MSVEAKVTSKGQITVPLKIRNELGVKPGDSIVFERKGNLLTVRPGRKENPFEKYRGIERKGRGATRKQVIDQLRGMRDGGEKS